MAFLLAQQRGRNPAIFSAHSSAILDPDIFGSNLVTLKIITVFFSISVLHDLNGYAAVAPRSLTLDVSIGSLGTCLMGQFFFKLGARFALTTKDAGRSHEQHWRGHQQ